MRRGVVGWGLLLLACLIAGQSVRDAWDQTGRPYPGNPMARGMGEPDHTAVVRLIEERAGVQPGSQIGGSE